MSLTNPITAQAATQTFSAPLRPMMLIGVFLGPNGNHILMRDRNGAILRLETDAPQNGLCLINTGEGWAMIRENDAIHRLVIG